MLSNEGYVDYDFLFAWVFFKPKEKPPPPYRVNERSELLVGGDVSNPGLILERVVDFDCLGIKIRNYRRNRSLWLGQLLVGS